MFVFLSQLACIMLADVSPGVSVPLAKSPEPVVAVDLRLVPITPQTFEPPVYEEWEFPIVAGAGLRSKFHSELSSFSFGPQVCMGAVRAKANSLPVVCAGAALAQLEWFDQEFGVGVGSPFIEPAIGFEVGQRQGTLVLSMPIEYMVRFNNPNALYVGLRLGWGPWAWMHSSEPEQIVRDCWGRCAGF